MSKQKRPGKVTAISSMKTYVLLQNESKEEQPFRFNIPNIREKARELTREGLLILILTMCEELEELRKRAQIPDGILLQPVIGNAPSLFDPDGTAYTKNTLEAYGFRVVPIKTILAKSGSPQDNVTPEIAHETLEVFARFDLGEYYVLTGENDKEIYVAFKPNEKFEHPETW